MRQCPADLISLAHELADAARPIARTYFRQNLGLEIKSDATPVTLADRTIEQEWRRIIMEKRPQDGILGEEFGVHQPDAEYQWIFDPIDGTKAFTLGRTSFGCLIALYHVQHGFILGLCDQPITDERWVGALGYPTTYNDNELPQRSLDVRGSLRVGITNPLRFKPALQQCFDALLTQKHVIGYGGDCLNFAGIASGLIDLSFANHQSVYDVAAFVPMLRGVGAVITQSDGKPLSMDMEDGVLASATP
ncbi:MAG TPA: inositol monophosphatase family protein, partial [Alphaproteobacteria bacterium]